MVSRDGVMCFHLFLRGSYRLSVPACDTDGPTNIFTDESLVASRSRLTSTSERTRHTLTDDTGATGADEGLVGTLTTRHTRTTFFTSPAIVGSLFDLPHAHKLL